VIKGVKIFYFFPIIVVSTCAIGTIFRRDNGELKAGKKMTKKRKK